MKDFEQEDIKDLEIGGRAASYEAAKTRVIEIKSYEVRQTATYHDFFGKRTSLRQSLLICKMNIIGSF